jgi:Tol biopolymer transport system component
MEKTYLLNKQELKMKKNFLFISLFVLVLVACSASPEPTATALPPTEISEPTLEPTAVPTTVPTDEPAPDANAPTNPQIVFVSNRGEDPNQGLLYLLDVDSGEISEIETGFNNVLYPKWSPDGTKILFAVPDVWNLYTIAPDGSDLTQITDFRSNNADWSPDGTKIVFQSDSQNEPENIPDIYMVDADGQNLVELVDAPDTLDFAPRWGTGNEIIFLSSRTGNVEIYLMDAGSGEVLSKVTEGGSSIINANISNNGERIVFVYPQGGKLTDLYVIDKSGDVGTVVRLTNDPTRDSDPAFTPDDEKIIYSSFTVIANVDVTATPEFFKNSGVGFTELRRMPRPVVGDEFGC